MSTPGFTVSGSPAGVSASVKPSSTSPTRTVTATTPQIQDWLLWGAVLAVAAGGAYAIYQQYLKNSAAYRKSSSSTTTHATGSSGGRFAGSDVTTHSTTTTVRDASGSSTTTTAVGGSLPSSTIPGSVVTITPSTADRALPRS